MSQNNIYPKKLLPSIQIAMMLNTFTLPVPAVNAAPREEAYANFNKAGKLVQPTGYREWIFVGAPLTPNDMNNGKAAFPEFHNVYIDPVSWRHWKQTGEFRDGTIVTKELVSVGSKQTFSGNGYFQGEYIGLEAMVKSKEHFPDAPGHWGFFRFTIENSSNLLKASTVQAKESCSTCHQSGATDYVFTQHYPVLRAAKAKGEMRAGGK